MNPKLQRIMNLIAELSPDERLHLADLLEEEYEIFLPVEAPSQPKTINGNKLTLMIKKGAIEHRYVSLSRKYEFFPADTIGETDIPAQKTIRLLVHGYANPIETDILKDAGRFRTREWKQFYRDNKIKEGSYVVIERISDYEYRVYPMELS